MSFLNLHDIFLNKWFVEGSNWTNRPFCKNIFMKIKMYALPNIQRSKVKKLFLYFWRQNWVAKLSYYVIRVWGKYVVLSSVKFLTSEEGKPMKKS